MLVKVKINKLTKLLLIHKVLHFYLEIIHLQCLKATGDFVVQSQLEVEEIFLFSRLQA